MAASTALPSIPIVHSAGTTTDPVANTNSRKLVTIHGGILVGGGAGTVTLQSYDGSTATDLTGPMTIASGTVIPIPQMKTLMGGGLRVVSTAAVNGVVYATRDSS